MLRATGHARMVKARRVAKCQTAHSTGKGLACSDQSPSRAATEWLKSLFSCEASPNQVLTHAARAAARVAARGAREGQGSG